MKPQDRPVGRPFSEVYIERGQPRSDSERARFKLTKYFAEYFGDHRNAFGSAIEREIGVPILMSNSLTSYYDIAGFFEHAEIADFLTSLTHMYLVILASREHDKRDAANLWKECIIKVFREENLAYEIDEECGVHLLVDSEFHFATAAALSSLQGTRYLKAASLFDTSLREFTKPQGSKKQALRELFEAVETIAKDRYGIDRLTRSVVLNTVRPEALKRAPNKAVKAIVEPYCNAFGDWVDAAHVFRHGQPEEIPAEPPDELAIALFSSGASFLRWFATHCQESS